MSKFLRCKFSRVSINTIENISYISIFYVRDHFDNDFVIPKLFSVVSAEISPEFTLQVRIREIVWNTDLIERKIDNRLESLFSINNVVRRSALVVNGLVQKD